MSSFAPVPPSLEPVGVHLCVASFRTDRGVVGRPPSDEGIEVLDQGCLWQRLVPLDDLFEGLLMPFDGTRTGGADGFEAQRDTLMPFPWVRFADRNLLHVKPQEIEADLVFLLIEGVRDVGRAGFQGHSHAC